MNTRITTSATKGATVYIVWYRCPISNIFQTYSSSSTLAEAQADIEYLNIDNGWSAEWK